ncbi:hypothetical protein BDW62DRAFT_177319 [Aspergillus aurantiobrunneus]
MPTVTVVMVVELFLLLWISTHRRDCFNSVVCFPIRHPVSLPLFLFLSFPLHTTWLFRLLVSCLAHVAFDRSPSGV